MVVNSGGNGIVRIRISKWTLFFSRIYQENRKVIVVSFLPQKIYK
ncbi:hypothetical protein NPIL_192151, partial [Nephila pilipes]